MSRNAKHWTQLLLSSDATIQDGIQLLERTALRIVMVVDRNLRLIGTVSDGDIRRGLLKGIAISNSILEITEKNALVVPPGISRDMILQLMSINKIQQIPIVDETQTVVGLHLWDEISKPARIDNLMVIMAGGRGKRLFPQTENCPKPMLQIAGKPILEHIIEKAKSEGFVNFAISIFYLGEQIEKYFGDGTKFGVNINYLREEEPLGTAGALKLLSPAPDKPFIVTNGDVLADLRYSELLEFHEQHSATATMAVRLHEIQNPFGEVKTSGPEIIGYIEKPIYRTHINAGVYCLNPEALLAISSLTPIDMPSLFQEIRETDNRTIAYPIHERWMDVGVPEELLRANQIATELKEGV